MAQETPQGFIDVHAHHVVTSFGELDRQGQTNIEPSPMTPK